MRIAETQLDKMIAENMTNTDVQETDLLIVGAGPAGASLACFLSEYGKLIAVPRNDLSLTFRTRP